MAKWQSGKVYDGKYRFFFLLFNEFLLKIVLPLTAIINLNNWIFCHQSNPAINNKKFNFSILKGNFICESSLGDDFLNNLFSVLAFHI